MTARSMTRLILITILTLGLYAFYWFYQTKEALNNRIEEGTLFVERVPSLAWLLVPFANIWWMWRFTGALSEATEQRVPRVGGFVVMLVTDWLSVWVFQYIINKQALERGVVAMG